MIPLANIKVETSLPYLSIKSINISQNVGEHGKLSVVLYVESDIQNNVVSRIQGSNIIVKSEDGEVIFSSKCTRGGVTGQSDYREVTIEALTASYDADIQIKNVTFQDPSKTLQSVIEKVLSPYGAMVEVEKDEKIAYILSQKEETDWKFVKRIAAQFGYVVFTDCREPIMKISIGEVGFKSQTAKIREDSLSRNMTAMRSEALNAESNLEVFEYEQNSGTSYNINVAAGDKLGDNIVAGSTIYSEKGVMVNKINSQHVGTVKPDGSLSRDKEMESQVLTGTVQVVKQNDIKVKLITDGDDGETVWIPYENVINNSFYSMPDIGDTVFIYYDNSGNAACLGSKRANTNGPDYEKPIEKALTSCDKMIKLATKSLDMTTTRKLHDKEANNMISVIMNEDDGISIKSGLDIVIEAKQNLIFSAVSEGKSGADFTGAQGEITPLYEAGAAKYKEDGGLTGLGIIGKGLEGIGSSVKDDTISSFKNFFAVDVITDVVGNLSPTITVNQEDANQNTSYENGWIDMFGLDKVLLKVDKSSLLMTDAVEIKTPCYNWLGYDHSEHEFVEDELHDVWENMLDVIQLGLDIAGFIPGIGAFFDIANAVISFGRGDYVGGAFSLLCAIPGVGDAAAAAKMGVKAYKATKALKTLTKAERVFAVLKFFGAGAQFGITAYRNKEDLEQLKQLVLSGKFDLTNPEHQALVLRFAETVMSGVHATKAGKDGAQGVVKGTETTYGTKSKTTDGPESDPSTTPKENGNDTSNTTHDGDPVDMVTGSLYLTHIDKILKDTLEDFKITRTYESIYRNENKLLGSRWLLNIESNISFSENKLIVRMPDNHMEHFIKVENRWVNERNDDQSFLLGETDGGYCLKILKDKKRYCYNNEGRLISIYDKNDNCTRLEYDGKTLVKLTLSSGQFLLFSYDKNKVTCITDNIGRKITYEYSGDLLTKVTYPNSGSMRYEYTPEGYIYKVWDQKGKNYITNHYDRKGRVVGQNMSDGEEYIYLYDDKNKTNTIITTSNNRTVRYEYNRNKVVTKTMYQDGTYKETKYDEWENPIYEKDRNGFETYRKYNAKCQLIEETLPEGLITNFEYDEEGNLIYKYDNQGRELKLTYDNRGNITKRQTRIDESTWQQQVYSYDARGRLVSSINSNKNEVKRYYNTSFNQPSIYVNATGEEFHYTYDEAGRKMSVKGELGTVKYGYNNLDYKTHIIDNCGKTTRLYYDPMNNLVKVVNPNELNPKTEDGPGTTFEYDDMDHLIRVTNPLGNINAYVKDSEGHVLKEMNPNSYDYFTNEGVGIEYRYDTDGNRTHIIYPNGGVERIYYDPNGNIIKKIQPLEYNQETDDGKGYTYLYDGNNRLVQITNPMGIVEKRYVYNLTGKIIKEIDSKGYLSSDNDENRIGTLYQYNTIGWLTEKREPIKVEHDKFSYRLTCYFYDSNGNIIKEKRYLDYQDEESKSGRVHTIDKQYDKNERLIKVSDCTGAAMEYQYNSHNQITYEKRRISDNTYMERIYSYDSVGRLEFIKANADETGTGKRYAKTLYEYDKNGNLIKITTPTGNEIRREYDVANNLIVESHIEKNGSIHNTTSFSYDKAGNLIKITDNAQNSLEYKYDMLNREVAKIGIDGGVSTTKYDLNGRILKLTSPNENKRIEKSKDSEITDSFISENIAPNNTVVGYQYTYDILGRMTAITRPDGIRDQISSYNNVGELVQQTDAVGSEIYFTYDFAGRRTGAKTNGTASQRYEYDALGNIIGVKDGNSNDTQYKLDKWGRIVSIVRADETTEEYAYDYAGNVIKSVDGKGNATSYEYNSLNKLAKMIDPSGAVEEYIYDLENRLKEHTDRNQNITSYSYNLYGNITLKKSLNANLQESYEYYQDGKLKAAISEGMRYDYLYYPNGLLKDKQASGRTLIAYEYDRNGNKTKQTDITGKVTEYCYNKLNQLIEVYDGVANIDNNGITYHNAQLSGNGNMLNSTMQSSNGKRQALYEYNLDGSINKITIGDNIISTYAYDLDKNIAALKTSLGQEELASFDYSYDGNANMLTKVSLSKISSFEYDNLNRIVKAEYPTYSEELFYDNAGNRARRVSQGLEELYQYDERNRLVQKTSRSVENSNDILGLNSNIGVNINTGVDVNPTVSNNVNEIIHYEYDNQGNLTKDNNITYTYDAFNRNVKAQITSGNIQINRYDAEGLRHEVEENGKLVQFLYSGKEIIVEKTQDETIRYVRGYGILSSDSEKARTYYHYVSDEANSVTHVTDDNSVLNKYEYDAFGNTTSCEENVHNPFRYRGQQFDAITNQYYLRARYYNPVIARFTQEDTYHGDGLNLYAYCANNPVKYYDPSGYSKVDANENQKALQDIVDEVNEEGGATPEVKTIIEDWADEYGVPKDSLGLKSKESPTDSSSVEPKPKVPSSKGGKNSGYYQDANGRWHRPNGQFASNAEVGISKSTVSNTNKVHGVSNISGVSYEGTIYRNVSHDPTTGVPYNPLEMNQYTIDSNHRYTKKGTPGLYFGDSVDTVAAELSNYKVFDLNNNRTTFSFNIKANNMLDIRDSSVRAKLGISLKDITGDTYDITHKIGDMAYSNGYNGLIVPSARKSDGVNIIIFNPNNVTIIQN